MSLNHEDYAKYRGKCKETCELLVVENPDYRLVRGYYMCPVWGKQDHWWCVDKEGEIIDPTVKQFPTNGIGADYIEFDGLYSCEQCGKAFQENDPDAYFTGHFAFCTGRCFARMVGL